MKKKKSADRTSDEYEQYVYNVKLSMRAAAHSNHRRTDRILSSPFLFVCDGCACFVSLSFALGRMFAVIMLFRLLHVRARVHSQKFVSRRFSGATTMIFLTRSFASLQSCRSRFVCHRTATMSMSAAMLWLVQCVFSCRTCTQNVWRVECICVVCERTNCAPV